MTALLTTDVSCIACSAAQGMGEVFPTFSLTQRPHSPRRIVPTAESLDYTPPSSVTFTMAGVSWVCSPSARTVQHSGGGGATYQTPYTPQVIQSLQHSGYGKHLVFLSCPDWQYNMIAGDFNEDDYVVYHRRSDVYPSDGFTINEVLTTIAGLAGVSLTSTLPSLHVSNATLTFQRGTTFLDMFRSVLPSGLQYTWETWDDVLRISLLTPTYSETSGVPPKAYDLTLDEGQQIAYDMVTVTGGLYKPSANVALGRKTGLGSVSSARSGVFVDETLEPETQGEGDSSSTTTRTRRYALDTEGNFFYTDREQDTTEGSLLAADGTASGIGTLSTISRVFSYENTLSDVYEEPRMIGREEIEGLYALDVASGAATFSGVSGETYYLADDLSVITKTNYDAMSEQPAILLAAGKVWYSEFRTTSETKTYITEDTATRDLPEGLEKQVSVTVSEYQAEVDGIWSQLTSDPMQYLSRIAAHVSAQGHSAITSFSAPAVRVASSQKRRITPVTSGSYAYTEESVQVDQGGAFKRDVSTSHINAKDLPSAPSKYRMRPLEATAGEWGDKIVTPLTASIPTNNPGDFSVWAGFLYTMLTRQDKMLSFRTRDYVLPVGVQMIGGTVAGFSVQQQGPSGECSLSIV